MNFEIKGKVNLELGKKEVFEIDAREDKIILNLKKIGKLKEIFKILKVFTNETKENQEQKKDLDKKETIKDVLEFLKEQGYTVSIKLKGITIIKDLESSSLSKLMNFI